MQATCPFLRIAYRLVCTVSYLYSCMIDVRLRVKYYYVNYSIRFLSTIYSSCKKSSRRGPYFEARANCEINFVVRLTPGSQNGLARRGFILYRQTRSLVRGGFLVR